MINKLIETLQQEFPVTEIALGETGNQKVGPAKFTIRQFKVDGVGNFTTMAGKAMFGVMKMDTVILTPFEKDAPLYSYDRIYVLGNDVLIQEFYDTRLAEGCEEELAKIEERKSMISAISDRDLGSHWYDDIKLPQSVAKEGKKCREAADTYTLSVFKDYLEMLKNAASCDKAAKIEKSTAYVDGLFENGGPSTDQFVDELGKEEARKLFGEVIFGVEAE